MPSNSETILTAQTHPGDSTTETVTGDKFKGDGFYGRADGVHTVQYNFDGLSGTITIQATLATTPTDADWFDVHSYTASQETANKYANITGNFVYLRAVLVYTDGTVNSIMLNH
jgi:phage-related tail fiber protein